MADFIQSGNPAVTSDLIRTGNKIVDIEKEANRTVTIANRVIEVTPKILNGDLKLVQCPEFCDLTLTYALYGKLVDKLNKHKYKQTQVLSIILNFLFPDLAQFLPDPLTNLGTHVRCFTKKAKRKGKLCNLYEPISKLYEAKCSYEWTDFTKCGITQDILVTGPLSPSSGCQVKLKNRHIILLLNLRNKYRLCWVKVVPQWLRFFGILQEDDCVMLQNIQSHWLELGVQAKNLRGNQLQEFLDAPYMLPKAFIKKNIELVPNLSNHNLSEVNKSACISSSSKSKPLKKVINLLRKKDQELATYRKKLNQKQNRLEDLSMRLCKTRLAKTYWYEEYHKISGVNLFDEDTEFSADLAYIQKIRKGAQYIKRIVQLRCSDKSSQFVESLLDETLIEELLEKILVRGINFDKGSNILLEILQELAQHNQGTSTKNFESQESKNTSIQDCLLLNNQIVPYRNPSATTEEVKEISDSHLSSVEKDIEQFLQVLPQKSKKKSSKNLESRKSKNTPVQDCLLINNQIVPYRNPSATTEEVKEISDSHLSSVEKDIEQFLQVLPQQSKKKSSENLESRKSKNTPVQDCLLINNQIVPYGNPLVAGTKEVVEISDDSDSFSLEDTIEQNQFCNDKESTNVLYDKTRKKFCDLSGKTNPDPHSETSNIPSQLRQNSSELIEMESSRFSSSKNSVFGLCNDKQMMNDSYVFTEIITNKRTYIVNKECSIDSGHVSHKDVNNYQPHKKLRLENRKPSVAINSKTNASYDSYSLAPVLENETCFSPSKTRKSIAVETAKILNHTNSSLSGNKPNQYSKGDKLERDLSILGNKSVSSLQTHSNLETCFGDPVDTDDDIIHVNSTTLNPIRSSSCLYFENHDYQPHSSNGLINKQISQVKPRSEINLDPVEITID